jgi:hypothetical protein
VVHGAVEREESFRDGGSRPVMVNLGEETPDLLLVVRSTGGVATIIRVGMPASRGRSGQQRVAHLAAWHLLSAREADSSRNSKDSSRRVSDSFSVKRLSFACVEEPSWNAKKTLRRASRLVSISDEEPPREGDSLS